MPYIYNFSIIRFLSLQNKDDKYGDNMKFRNFAFDVKEFMRIVSNMVQQVKKNLQKQQKWE